MASPAVAARTTHEDFGNPLSFLISPTTNERALVFTKINDKSAIAASHGALQLHRIERWPLFALLIPRFSGATLQPISSLGGSLWSE